MLETELIQWIQQNSIQEGVSVSLGIGDDAAVLHGSMQDKIVVTKDVLFEGIHFDSASTPSNLIGRKALAVNLSDIAAMGTQPIGYLLGLGIPQNMPQKTIESILQGIFDLAKSLQLPLLGGDTNVWAGPLVLSVTAIGKQLGRGVARRDAAKAGQRIFVTGSLGGSRHHKEFLFEPRIKEGILLQQLECVTAMMDISDGLAKDLPTLCWASNVGAVIDTLQIPYSPSIRHKSNALERALCDGEDFELLFTVKPEGVEELLQLTKKHALELSEIGWTQEDHQIILRLSSGEEIPMSEFKGFEHGQPT